jgi:hypothetical protein
MKDFEFFKPEDPTITSSAFPNYLHVNEANRLLNERGIKAVGEFDNSNYFGFNAKDDIRSYTTHEALLICPRPIEQEEPCDLCPKIKALDTHIYMDEGDEHETSWNIELKPVKCPKCGGEV